MGNSPLLLPLLLLSRWVIYDYSRSANPPQLSHVIIRCSVSSFALAETTPPDLKIPYNKWRSTHGHTAQLFCCKRYSRSCVVATIFLWKWLLEFRSNIIWEGDWKLQLDQKQPNHWSARHEQITLSFHTFLLSFHLPRAHHITCK